MKTNHTPGPWHSNKEAFEHHKHLCRFEVFAGDQCIADVWGNLPSSDISVEAARSNAVLIAAAPDLLGAAKAAEIVIGKQQWLYDSPDPEAVALHNLRAAIAKAEGE